MPRFKFNTENENQNLYHASIDGEMVFFVATPKTKDKIQKALSGL